MNFINAKTLIEICENENIKISEAMLRRETEISGESRENIVARMKRSLDVMRESVAEAGNNKRNAWRLYRRGERRHAPPHKGKRLCGRAFFACFGLCNGSA